jgi:hypothetical protein
MVMVKGRQVNVFTTATRSLRFAMVSEPVSPTNKGAAEGLSPAGRAILDLARVALAGDRSEARGLVQRLIRRPPISDGIEEFRANLGDLIVRQTDAGRQLRGGATAPVPMDAESLLPLVRDDVVHAWRPVLPPAAAAEVDAFLFEHGRGDDLRRAGLEPGRSMLLIGPPGSGKTLTARFLARELQLPLVSIDLAGLVSALLGRTGQNLRLALDYARAIPCLLLLDEFDALAKRRDDDSDVGELKRIVSVLLLELERWPDGGVLVAATNHPELLDRAVRRRFDRIVELPLPDGQGRREILTSSFSRAGHAVSEQLADVVARVTDGASGSDLDRIVSAALRRSVMERKPVDEAFLGVVLSSLHQRAGSDHAARQAFAVVAVEHAGLSRRETARMLHMSHPTVLKLLNDWHASEAPLDG